MFTREMTRVKVLKTINGINVDSLEHSLKPLWVVTYYGCALFDWCKEIPNKSCWSILIHSIGIFICLSLMKLGFGYEAYQLSQEIIKPNSTINSVLPNLIWVSNYPPGIVAALVFLIQRNDLLSFFKKWKCYEEQIILKPKTNFKWLFALIYGLVVVLTAGLVAAGVSLLLQKPDASYLLSYYPIFVEHLTLPGIIVLHFISSFWSYCFIILADLVPAWTFFHIGQALRSLALEVREHFDELPGGQTCKKPCLQHIRVKFEILSNFTDKANQLFGKITIVNQGLIFFMICAEFYNVLKTIRKSDGDTLSSFLLLVISVTRFFISFLMAAHLESSTDQLKSTVSVALLEENKLSAEDFQKCKLFLSRLKDNPLIVKPLNLYRMTPALLLTIANLSITYVVVLLQSEN